MQPVYADPQGRFQIMLPPRWGIATGPGIEAPLLAMLSEPDAPIQSNAVVTVDEDVDSFAQWQSNVEEMLPQVMADFVMIDRVLGSSEPVDSLRRLATYTFEGRAVAMLQFAVLSGSRGVTATFTCGLLRLPEFMEDFLASGNSLDLTAGTA